MKKTPLSTGHRKTRRTPRKNQRPIILPAAGLPLGTQQALMGLAAFEARHR